MFKFLSRYLGPNPAGYVMLIISLVIIGLFIPLWSGFLALLGWSTWNYWVAPTFHLGEVAYLPIFVVLLTLSILSILSPLWQRMRKRK
jgi:hypothetical protein